VHSTAITAVANISASRLGFQHLIRRLNHSTQIIENEKS
jgi:hypothetical protein